MAGTEGVRLMADVEWLVLCGLLLIAVVICLIAVAYLDYQVSKLRKDNKFLRRVLDDYFRLEDGAKRAAQAINREAGRASWIPPGWRL